MISRFFSVLLIFIVFHSNAQDAPKWININGGDDVNNFYKTGDTIWVGFAGGMSWINANDETLIHNFNSTNSAIQGNSIKEFVVSPNQKAWFTGNIHQTGYPDADSRLNLQHFDGQNFIPAADNLHVLDSLESKYDLRLSEEEELFFREGYQKIWKLKDYHLEEIDLVNGFDLISNLYVDNENNLFASLEDNATTIGMYQNNIWTIYDLSDSLPETSNFSSMGHFGNGPDGKLYVSLCTNFFNCYLLRFDYQNWEVLMELSDEELYFLWSPSGNIYFNNIRTNTLKFVEDWEFVDNDRVRLNQQVDGGFKKHIWLDNDELWSASGSFDGDKLYKSNISLNPNGFFYNSTDFRNVNAGNSILSTNKINKLSINSDLLKLIVLEDKTLLTFDGEIWDTIITDTLDYNYDIEDMQLFSNETGITFMHDGGNEKFLIHQDQSIKEYRLSNYVATNLLVNNDGNLLFQSGGFSNFAQLDTLGNFIETDIPEPVGFGSQFMTIDHTDLLWIFNDHISVAKPQFYDGQWNTVNLPSNSYFVGGYHPTPFVDSENNIYLLDSSNHLLRYNQITQTWEVIDIPIPDDNISYSLHRKLAEDSKGNIWIASEGIGLFKYDGTDWVLYNQFNSGLSSLYFSDFDIDIFDNLWISTYYGINVFNEEGIEVIDSTTSYRLEGQVYFDINDDEIFTSDVDVNFQHVPLSISPLENRIFTNQTGKYGLNVLQNDYVVILDEIDFWTPVNGYEKPITVDNDNVLDADFRMIPDTFFNQITVHLTGNQARCDNAIYYYAKFKNTGTTLVNGRLIIKPDSLGQILGSTPALIYDSEEAIYYYDFQNFRPLDFLQFEIEYQVPDFQHIGKQLDWEAKVQLLEQETYIDFDSTLFSQIVKCSWDPNDKLVQSQGQQQDSLALIRNELLYTIRFQNTGNDTAYDIEIIDTLDTQFDINSLKIIQASHDFETYVEKDYIIHFLFNNINLPDSISNEPQSHGLIQYLIDVKDELSPPIVVSNTAYIYFDNNPPIQTNTPRTILLEDFPTHTNEILDNLEKILVFPNPFSDRLYLDWRRKNLLNEPLTIGIYAIDGCLVKKITSNVFDNVLELNFDDLSTGCYFIKLKTKSTVEVHKIIKQ